MTTLLHLHASDDTHVLAVDHFFAAVDSQASVHRSSCIMPSISDRSVIVKGRSPPERRGELLIFTSKRNERETRHALAAATRLHLPPEAIRNLVELVRSRRRFSGVENRPHLF